MKSFELSVNQNKSYLKSIIMKFSSSMLYDVFDFKIDRIKDLLDQIFRNNIG